MNNSKTLSLQPTIRQRKTFEYLVANGGSLANSMRRNGYSEAMARNSHKLSGSNGWQILVQETFQDERLARMVADGLDAVKPFTFYDKQGKKVVEAIPDMGMRFKYLVLALKLKGLYPNSRKKEVPQEKPFSLVEMAEASKEIERKMKIQNTPNTN